MHVRPFLAIVSIVSLLSSMSYAGTATTAQGQQAEAQLSADSLLLSNWAVDNMRRVVAFNSTSGQVVPKQLQLFGFSLGVQAQVTGTEMDVTGLRNLNTSLINTQEIDMFDRMPFPAIIAHAKLGLPLGFDAGVRFGGIPEKDINEGDTRAEIKNKIFGIDVRKSLISEGLGTPGLTLGLSYTHSDGEFMATTPYSEKGAATVAQGGNTYTADLVGTGRQKLEWDTNSIGAQLVVNKKVAFINPWVGVSVNHNSGSVSNTLTTVGTVTLTGPSTVSDTLTSEGTASRDPHEWDTRAMAGIEFSLLPFVKLGINGEYAGNRNLAGGIGLRAQFR
jgi:hypothetical protein